MTLLHVLVVSSKTLTRDYSRPLHITTPWDPKIIMRDCVIDDFYQYNIDDLYQCFKCSDE